MDFAAVQFREDHPRSMAIRVSPLNVVVSRDFPQSQDSAHFPEGAVTAGEWDALLRSSASNVVFLTCEWLQSWWRHFGPQEAAQLLLLTLRDSSGALAAIAPLCISSAPLPTLKEYVPGEQRPVGQGEAMRLVRFLGGTEVADYLDVIAPVDTLRDAWSAVFDYLISHRDEWDLIDLHSLPEWSPSRSIVAEEAQARGLRVDVVAEDVCPVLALPDNWDAYMASLRKKDRHELRRKVRKLEGRDVVHWYLVSCTDPAAVDRGMQIFLDLHRQSGPDKAEFMTGPMAQFFLDTAHSMAQSGWLDLAILELDSQPAAAYFSFVYSKRIYLYNSGYDPRFSSYSAGIALLAYRIHKALNQGCKYFDFLRGDEPYKYDFGGKDTFVYRALVSK